MRAQIVKDLQLRLRDPDPESVDPRKSCTTCSSLAAFQLALCYYTAFGTPRDLQATKTLLGRGGNKLKGMRKACKEIQFWEAHYYSERIDSESLGVEPNYGFEEDLPDNDFTIRRVPEVVDFYEAEIEGKIQSEACHHSAIVLQRSIGKICTEAYMYEKAEEVYRAAIDMLKTAPPISIGIMGIDKRKQRRMVDEYKEYLAEALQSQGKLKDAIKELETTGIFRKEAGTAGQLLEFAKSKVKKRTAFEWRDCVESKVWMMDLLLEQYKSSRRESDLYAVMASGLISDLGEKAKGWKNSRKMNLERDLKVMKSALKVLKELAEAWTALGHGAKSRAILDERVRLCAGFFDEDGSKDSNETYSAKHDLAVGLLLDGAYPDALMILEKLSTQSTYDEIHPERLELMTAISLTYSRMGADEKAMDIMGRVLQIKRATFGDSHPINLGCMNDLAGSLSILGEKALSTPAALQHDLLAILKASSDREVRTRTMDLLWHFSKSECLYKVLSELDSFLALLKSKDDHFGSIVKIQTSLVFMLSHLGFTFEDATILEQAEAVNLELKERHERYFSADSVGSLSILESMACISWMKCNILCKRKGFGRDDFAYFERLIESHAAVYDLSSTLRGPRHCRTIDAMERWAIALSDIGFARDNEEMILKSQDLYEEAILMRRDNPDSASAGPPDDNGDESSHAAYHLAILQFKRKNLAAKDLRFSYKKMRDFLYGAEAPFHPGELALLESLVYTMLEEHVPKTPSRKLSRAFSRFRRVRKEWDKEPELHPDYLRATESYAYAEYQNDRGFRERLEARNLKWIAKKVHTEKSQYHCILRYKMSLSRALSENKCDWDEAMAIAKEVVNASMETSGTEHTRTAAFTEDLARLHERFGREIEARRLYAQALQTYSLLLGVKHSESTGTWNYLFKILAKKQEQDELSGRVTRLLKKFIKAQKREPDVKKPDISSLRKWALRAGASRIVLGGEHEFSKGASLVLQSLCQEYNLDSNRVKSVVEELTDFGEFSWLHQHIDWELEVVDEI